MNISELFKKLPLVYISLAFITGLLMGTVIYSTHVSIIFFVIGFSILFFKKDSLFIVGVWICIAAFGMFNMHASMEEQQFRNEIANEYHGKTIVFKGIVVEIKATEKGFKYRLQLTGIDHFQTWLFQKKKLECEISDTLAGKGEFQDISSVRNPGKFKSE